MTDPVTLSITASIARVLASITIIHVFYGLALLAGLMTIPLVAWVGGPSLPVKVAEPIANGLWKMVVIGTGRGLFNQRETGEYEWRRATRTERDAMEPREYWFGWALGRVGITFEKTKRAFGTYVGDPPLEHLEAESKFPGKQATADCERGGKDWYIDLSADPANIFVPIGEKLAELKGAGGAKEAEHAIAESKKEHGGDTSGYSMRLDAVASFVFLLTGIATGYVVFF